MSYSTAHARLKRRPARSDADPRDVEIETLREQISRYASIQDDLLNEIARLRSDEIKAKKEIAALHHAIVWNLRARNLAEDKVAALLNKDGKRKAWQ